MITLNTKYGVQYNDSNGVFVMNGVDPTICYYNSNCASLYRNSNASLVSSLNNDKFNYDLITDASSMYYYCNNLTGSPVCGDNVTDASYMYYYCNNLTGSPVCGSNVTNASYMYYGCYNLTGSPVCGSNVTNASSMYRICNNLTGSPVCGDNVTNASHMYYDCYNLTGSPVCGSNVTNASYMYYYCYNLTGGATLRMPNCDNINMMFQGLPYSNTKTLYLNLRKFGTFTSNASAKPYSGITWTSSGSTMYYNTKYKIYVYNIG